MLQTNAMFLRKESSFDARDCVIEKVIRLSGAEYDRFASNMLRDEDFIKENAHLCRPDSSGRLHCLLVVGEGRRDGVLVDPSGYDYARYSAFIPNVEDFLTVGRYPALAALNRKLTEIADDIAERVCAAKGEESISIDLEELEAKHDTPLLYQDILDTVMGMLDEVPGIESLEIDKNELVVYREPDAGAVSGLTDAEREFAAWQARTESSRFKWTEDEIFRLNGRGAFYYTGGEDGIYIKIHKDGLLEAGTYEGAIPHIGEASFTVDAARQCKDYSEAFTAAMEAGGKRFMVDMFSQDSTSVPVAPVAAKPGKPSVAEQIKAARQAPHSSRDKDAQKHKKDKGGPEL